MSNSSAEEIWKFKDDLLGMFESGEISQPLYFKSLIFLSSDLMCKHFETDKSLILLNLCVPEYLTSIMIQQMMADQAFASSVVNLSYRLVQLGIFQAESVVTNIPQASA